MAKVKAKLQWWVIPSIVTGSVAALTALGTLAINYATFAALPKRVEAGEQKNTQQDETLNKLTGIQETWQQIYQQQQQAQNTTRSRRCEYQEEDGAWWCRDDGCDGDDGWYRCD